MSDENIKLREITRAELLQQWPQSDDGHLCSRLLKRYVFTLLVDSALGAECTESRAQAESGANKALALLVKDFERLSSPAPAKKKTPGLTPLHRFQKTDLEKPANPT